MNETNKENQMTDSTGNDNQKTDSKDDVTNFEIQKIYIKDISFECPNSPEMFSIDEWEPEIDVRYTTRSAKVTGDIYECTLTTTLTARINNKAAFLVEVKQAGIFVLTGFDDDQLHGTLNSYCPHILFPYTREAVSTLITKGGFPPVLLEPVNFDLLYKQHLDEKESSSKVNSKTNN